MNSVAEPKRERQRSAAPRGRSKAVMADVWAERRRQVKEEGFDAGHDDQPGHAGQLAAAGAAYAWHAGRALNGGTPASGRIPVVWPWGAESWKPKDARRDLIRAAALIVAEIERLDRGAAHHADQLRMDLGEST